MPSNKHAMVTEKTKQKKSDETGNVRPINVCKSIRFFAIFAKRLCIKKNGSSRRNSNERDGDQQGRKRSDQSGNPT